jgi:hypothetical protein
MSHTRLPAQDAAASPANAGSTRTAPGDLQAEIVHQSAAHTAAGEAVAARSPHIAHDEGDGHRGEQPGRPTVIRRCSAPKSGRGPDQAMISASRTKILRPAETASTASSG